MHLTLEREHGDAARQPADLRRPRPRGQNQRSRTERTPIAGDDAGRRFGDIDAGDARVARDRDQRMPRDGVTKRGHQLSCCPRRRRAGGSSAPWGARMAGSVWRSSASLEPVRSGFGRPRSSTTRSREGPRESRGRGRTRAAVPGRLETGPGCSGKNLESHRRAGPRKVREYPRPLRMRHRARTRRTARTTRRRARARARPTDPMMPSPMTAVSK